MQSKLSFNPGSSRRLFPNNGSKERPKRCDAFRVSPFKSKLGNEMQEMIVFLMPFHNGPFLKEVSVMLKVELKLNRSFMSLGNL